MSPSLHYKISHHDENFGTLISIARLSDQQNLTLSLPLLAAWASANLLPRQAGDPCVTAAPCVSLVAADNSCTDDACFCPRAMTLARECASCYATVNATVSSLLVSVALGCSSELAAGTSTASTHVTAASTHAPTISATGGSGADPCATNSACVSIFNAANSCANDACFCPTALERGSACSHCYVTVNATLAADISSAIVGCASEGFSATGTATSTKSPSIKFKWD